MEKYYGGIEAGGTKFVCAIGCGPDDIIEEIRFPTTIPEETFGKALTFFRDFQMKNGLEALGIATFGPVDLNPSSPSYGFITETPKHQWSNADFMSETLPLLGLMVIVFASVQVIDNVLFQPLIYSSSVKSHPLEIFLVIMAAGSAA